MGAKSLSELKEHALYLIFMGVILVLFWYSIWGIADEFQEYFHKKYNLSKLYFYTIIILVIVLTIGLHPQFLEKL